MTIYTDTKELFERGLKNQLDTLEKERIKVTRKKKFFQYYLFILIGAFLLCFILKLLSIVFQIYFVDFATIFAIVVLLLVWALIIITAIAVFSESKAKKEKKTANLISKIKNLIYPKCIKILDTQLKYEQEADYKLINSTSDLLRKFLCYNFELINLEDRIYGKYLDNEVNIVEFQLGLDSKTTFNSNEKEVFANKLFSGVLFSSEIKKNISSPLIITNKYIPVKAELNKWEKVNLESEEFNNNYNVYCNDQVEARYFLTPTIMEGLLKLNKQGSVLCIILNGNNINIIKQTFKDYFEIDITKPVNIPYQYSRVISEIKEVLDFIEILKLNLDVGL